MQNLGKRSGASCESTESTGEELGGTTPEDLRAVNGHISQEQLLSAFCDPPEVLGVFGEDLLQVSK